MTATYSDLFAISNSTLFQRRAFTALASSATAINGEDPATVGHASRVAFAAKVGAGQFNLQAASLCILTVPSVASVANLATLPGYGITDAQIQTAAAAIFSMLSGV